MVAGDLEPLQRADGPRPLTLPAERDEVVHAEELETFLAKVHEHGIRYVSVRPGPYINAEWGPTGFGAIPRWFPPR